MQDIIATLIQEYLPQIVIGVLGLVGSLLGKHVGRFVKANTNAKQRETIKDVASDIYQYVEREFGEKLRKTGQEKFDIGLEMFYEKMAENEIKVNEKEFGLQIERLIREEKSQLLAPIQGILETEDTTDEQAAKKKSETSAE